MSIPQQINFLGKLEEDGATMFFSAEKQGKTILNFCLDSLIETIISTMEHQKILNLLNEASDYTFVTRKWNIVNDQLNAKC